MGIPVNTMKWIDLHLGVPACWFLTQARRIAGLFRGSLPAPGPIARILYIELSEMGSMVAAGPVMRSFRDRHPDAQMFFLTFRQNRACLDVLQLVPPENVITIETGNLAIFLRSLWAALRRMRRLRLDAVVDFELFSRISAILAQLSGARLSVGFDRLSLEGLYRGHLKTHPVGYNHYAHISRNFLSLLEALDGAPLEQGLLKKRMEETPLPIPRPPRDEARRAELWRRLQTLCPALAARSRLVILNPNAGPLLPIRAWPLDRYIELARRLLADPDVCVLVMGTAEASADAARMVRELTSPRLVDFTQKTAFEDLIPLFSLGDVLVTNDSGPAHFASLTDIATVVFFGPETPDLYRPLTPRSHCFFAGYHCSPCLNAYNHRSTRCTDNRCLQCIGVDVVEAKVREFLARDPVPPRP